MSVLIIGATERELIKGAIFYARMNPVSMSSPSDGGIISDTNLLKLEDRKPGLVRPPSAQVVFPGGFRAAFSIEQQPVGLCTHLSISVEGRSKKGAMPSPQAVQMIAEEFGVPFPANGRMWMEEFEPGEFAINLLSVYAPTTEGTA